MDNKKTEQMFRGQARLVRLLLWKVGETTDIETCLVVAQDRKMIGVADVVFLRECLDVEERCRNAEQLDREVTQEMVVRLQRCADRLNRADSA